MGQDAGCCEKKPNINDEILMEANVHYSSLPRELASQPRTINPSKKSITPNC